VFDKFFVLCNFTSAFYEDRRSEQRILMLDVSQ
jgi:hypothetical protein